MFNMSQDGHNLFEMTFSNGWKVVVEWGAGVESDENTAQVKAYTPSNELYVFETSLDIINGYCTSDKVADFISYIRHRETV